MQCLRFYELLLQDCVYIYPCLVHVIVYHYPLNCVYHKVPRHCPPHASVFSFVNIS